MISRVLLFLCGAGLGGAGAYLGWRHDLEALLVLPPAADSQVWMAPAVFALVSAGLAAAGAAFSPARAGAGGEAAEARLRATERGWRSAPLPPDAAPPAPAAPPPKARAQQAPAPASASRAGKRDGPAFRTNATLHSIARPPLGLSALGAPGPTSGSAAGTDTTAAPKAEEASPETHPPSRDSLSAVEQLLADARLGDAQQMIERLRGVFAEAGSSLDAARLTVLAGEHALASGRPSEARWLWRLSMQRFAAAGGLSEPWARRAGERLRLSED